MNKIMNKKWLCLLMAMLMVFALTGCSGDSQKKEDAAASVLNVTVAQTRVSDEMLAGLKEELAKVDIGMEITVTGVSMSDPDKDPMGFMAGSTQLGGRIASKEIDVFITDADTARRMGENGEGYLAIGDTFTQEESAQFAAKPVGVQIVNDEGELTGEESAPCGVILSENASKLTGYADMQMFIIMNTTQPDNAKKVFAHLAAMP